MWLALAAIRLATAIGFNVLASAIQFERQSVIGLDRRPPANSEGSCWCR
jgi:hypothetical protein